MDTLKEPIFVTTNYGIVFGADYHRNKNKVIIEKLNLQRAKNVASGTSFETQLKSEFTGEISAIIGMANALANGDIQNEEDQFNAFWATV